MFQVLSLIGGMAKGHENSQKAIAEETLHVLHRLEQVCNQAFISVFWFLRRDD